MAIDAELQLPIAAAPPASASEPQVTPRWLSLDRARGAALYAAPVVGIFLFSRVALNLVVILTNHLLPAYPDYGFEGWAIQAEPFRDALFDMWTRFDSGFYIDIGFNGYWTPGQEVGGQNWTYFPAYGWLMALIAQPLGGPPAAAKVGIAISLIGLLVGLFALRELARDHGAPDVATVAFAAVFPSSFYLNAVYSEGMFFGAVALSLLLAGRGHFWAAGLAAAVAAVTRPPGILLILPLAGRWLATMRGGPRPHPAFAAAPLSRSLPEERGEQRQAALGWRRWIDGAALLLPIAAFGGLLLMFQRATGDPFAFLQAQTDWNRGQLVWPWEPLLTGLRAPLANIDPATWYLTPIDTGVGLLALGASIYLLWTRRIGLGLFGLALLLLPLSTGTLQSLTRYMAVNVPIFLALGLVAGRPEWLRTAALVTSAILLGFEAVLFAAGVHSVV